MKFLFSSKSGTPAKAIAKSIVSNFVLFLYIKSILGILLCFSGVFLYYVDLNPMVLLLQVYLLKPGSSAQEYFERLANLLEQYSFLTSYLTLWFSCISYHVITI